MKVVITAVLVSLVMVMLLSVIEAATGRWVERPGHNKTYFFSDTTTTLDYLRETACGTPEVRRDDNLCCPLTVNDQDEQDFIAANVGEYWYWIGLYCQYLAECGDPLNEKYLWVRGDHSDYRAPSFQPSTNPLYVFVDGYDNAKWFWARESGYFVRSYICEFESECAPSPCHNGGTCDGSEETADEAVQVHGHVPVRPIGSFQPLRTNG